MIENLLKQFDTQLNDGDFEIPFARELQQTPTLQQKASDKDLHIDDASF